jgi:hypothetical protein
MNDTAATYFFAATRNAVRLAGTLLLLAGVLGLSACASSSTTTSDDAAMESSSATPPSPDPRVGLEAGLFDAEQATWNLDVLSSTKPPEAYIGKTNSDLAFTGKYAIQGNYHGILIWDISNPSSPELVTDYVCPASQNDVSVYQDLLFVSTEGMDGRLDCGTQGIDKEVSQERMRGIRIFDISDIENPELVTNVQTCRGSHTHSVHRAPDDEENAYIYVSGSAPVRPEEELAGCSDASPEEDPNTALFRIEVIKVPLDAPEEAEIVNSPRIFKGLTKAPQHGLAPADRARIEEARKAGKFIIEVEGTPRVLPDRVANRMLNGLVKQRGGSGAPTAADSATLRKRLPKIVEKRFGSPDEGDGPEPGPTQCHDITLYPEIGRAGGACEGYGLLLDISDPAQPERIDAVADSNFSYWHSATFNNAGTKLLFTDEWGGGRQPKCRATDPMEWGANAIFSTDDGEMSFESYYKMPATQTEQENCVAHNGSLVPIPGRDVMVQAWYQGGVSVFDWTDPENPVEIAFHDRGPVDSTQMQMGGSWSVYWYDGMLVSSEIARGLDIFKLEPSAHLSDNELAAARTVELDYLNAQGQPKYTWPPSFVLARAYLDQLERSGGLSEERIASARQALDDAEEASDAEQQDMLMELSETLSGEASDAPDAAKVQTLAEAVRELAAAPETAMR